MELTIHVSDEIKARAESFGLAPEMYAEHLVSKALNDTRPRDFAAMQAAADRIRAFRQTHTLDGLPIKDLINEGRKY